VAGPGTGRNAELTLPPTAASASRARHFVADTLDGWGLDGVDDVVLLASELVTNALLHARTQMTVRVTEEGDGVVVLSVSDGSVQAPRGRQFSLESGTGRGLHLLESLAEDWGSDVRQDGKTVWCRVRLGGMGAFAGFDLDSVEAL
jgi:two-component sensor histidine kinase